MDKLDENKFVNSSNYCFDVLKDVNIISGQLVSDDELQLLCIDLIKKTKSNMYSK